MKNILLKIAGILVFFSVGLSGVCSIGLSKGNTISGYVRDAKTGEYLIGATVYVTNLEQGAVTNLYGFYSININPGKYKVLYSYIGYQNKIEEVELTDKITLNIDLIPESKQIKEVEIVAEKRNANITRAEMGVSTLNSKTIQKIPALMGEVDIIKAIQLLPGVQASSEGSSGFSVRGGNIDQNLILLDEAAVYNASHLMGFFSVFNNDAIKDIKLYKGDIPAYAGGRLASLLDIRMKDGNSHEFKATGGIGTISSRLTLEGPIFSEKTSFLLSGRRTYLDVFLPFAKNKDIRDNSLFFYDLNMKINHRINDNNRIFLSGYFGRDVFKNKFAGFGFGNNTLTFRWNHLLSQQLFMNLSLIRSQYNYELGADNGEPSSFLWKSNMLNYSGKIDFNYYINPEFSIRFGINSTYYEFSPAEARGTNEESFITKFILPHSHALEHAIYFSAEQKATDRINIKYGVRCVAFQNIGTGTFYQYDNDYNAIDSTVYPSGKIFNFYGGIEPRLALTYTITPISSVKASYSRTTQYIHLASNSTSGTPLDVWFPSSPNVKPQMANQYSVGYFHNLWNNKIETSFELYYKKAEHAIDFKDNANLLLNPKLEGELRFGSAKSYGLEVLLRLTEGKATGWIGYTWSHSYKTIETVNYDEPYSTLFDKPHDISLVFNYDLSPRISLSANWIYTSGTPITYPAGQMKIENATIPVVTRRNSQRMPDYHRLDVSAILQGKKNTSRKWQSEWSFSVYNAYARKNAWAINFVEDKENPGKRYAEMTYLFSFVPAITYNFKF